MAAIFSSRLLNGKAPVIFEDGRQSRDFIHVRDIARACVMALELDSADYDVLNFGTGRRLTVLDIAQMLAQRLNPGIEADSVGQYRAGDIRHCYADLSRIQLALGFEPQINFEQGIEDLVGWVIGQQASDRVAVALDELVARGLVR